MIRALASILAAGLLPPSNGVRFVERDPIAELVREVPNTLTRAPCPEPLPRPSGWSVASKVTPKERRWADRVLRLNPRIGAFAVRRVEQRALMGRVEWHRHGDGPWHRGVSLYVRVPWAK